METESDTILKLRTSVTWWQLTAEAKQAERDAALAQLRLAEMTVADLRTCIAQLVAACEQGRSVIADEWEGCNAESAGLRAMAAMDQAVAQAAAKGA